MLWDVTIAYLMIATVMLYLNLRTVQEHPEFITLFGMAGALKGCFQAAAIWPIFLLQAIITVIRRL